MPEWVGLEQRRRDDALGRLAAQGHDESRSPSALAAALGNRAFTEVARQPRGLVVQRMLYQLGQDRSERDTARRLRETDPVEYRDGEIRDLREGEVLHLVAHAGTDTFGKMKVDDLAAWLTRQKLPAFVTQIQLHGCQSQAFAGALESLLRTQKREVTVKGVPGYHFVTEEGASYSVPPGPGEKDELWEYFRTGITEDPTDAKVKALVEQYTNTRGEEPALERLENLKSHTATLQALRGTVRDRLEQQVNALARRPGSDLEFQRRDARSYEKQIDRLIALSERAPTTAAGELGEGGRMAAEARDRAITALTAILESGGVEEKERKTLADALKTAQDLTEPFDSLDPALHQLRLANDAVLELAESESTAAFTSAFDDLEAAELKLLKEPLLRKLAGLRSDDDPFAGVELATWSGT